MQSFSIKKIETKEQNYLITQQEKLLHYKNDEGIETWKIYLLIGAEVLS